MLSETSLWQGDDTFHNCAKYFGQLYVIHAHFPARQFDEKDQSKPWQRRTSPCVWVLMKTEFIIDFEVAAMQSIKIFFHHAGK